MRREVLPTTVAEGMAMLESFNRPHPNVRALSHAELTVVAERWLSGTRRCNVVLTERGFGSERCDAMGWARHLVVVECKVSRADFYADVRKPHRVAGCGLGRERWYLTMPGLLGAHEVPEGWGLLEWTGRTVRRAKPAPVLEHKPEMWMHELAVALGELRKYQAQGIRYRRLNPSGGYADAGALGSLEART